MKIKTLKQLGAILMMSGLLISCYESKEEPTNDSTLPTRAELKKAVATLNRFGDQIAAGNLSEADKQLIKELANTATPMSVFINQNAVLATGINFETKEDIVINAVTGKRIDACNRTDDIKQATKVESKCKTQAIAPNEAVKAVLSITQPIKGKILKNGIEIDATYLPGLTILHESSYCYTRIIAGKQKEICYSY